MHDHREMGWTAVVPLKPAGTRKGRLASSLSAHDRERLSQALLGRLIAALESVSRLTSIHIVSIAQPVGLATGWIRDHGRGLNAEMEAARRHLGTQARLLVIHADLPLIAGEDIDALLTAAEVRGCAVAPDRHGEGTNAIALADGRPFTFAFGPDSLVRHLGQVGEACVLVERHGLALDCDTADDLDLAIAAGFPFAAGGSVSGMA